MRKFKFRAWHKEQKKMVYDGFCLIPTSSHWSATVYDSYNETIKAMQDAMLPDHRVKSNEDLMEMYYSCGDYSVFDWADADIICGNRIIMQYTGLKDKNGKEIYEGDILTRTEKTRCCGKEVYKMIGDVVWADDAPQFAFHDGMGNMNYGWANMENEDVEVIGNIYENPDIMEKEMLC